MHTVLTTMRNWIHTAHFNARARQAGFVDFERAIRECYAQGQSIQQIAAILDMDDSCVWHHLVRMQIARRPRGGWQKNRPQLIVMYQGREWTTSELARELGTYRERLLNWLYAGRLPGASYEKRIVT